MIIDNRTTLHQAIEHFIETYLINKQPYEPTLRMTNRYDHQGTMQQFIKPQLNNQQKSYKIMDTTSKCILSIKEYNITTRLKVKHVQKMMKHQNALLI